MALGTAAAIGLGIAGAGTVGQFFAGRSGAKAQGAAAQAMLNASMPSADELANLDAMLKQQSVVLENQGKMLQRQTAILGATDPALMEASKQAYDILKGKQTAATSGYQKLADRERDALREQLASELGGNYASTTIGQRAMRDLEERQQFQNQQIQQGQLGSLLGVAQTYQNSGVTQANNAVGMYDQSLVQRANALNAIKQRGIPYAGAPYVQDIQNSRGLSDLFGGLAGLGGQLAGYGIQENRFNRMMDSRRGNINFNVDSGGTGSALGRGMYGGLGYNGDYGL